MESENQLSGAIGEHKHDVHILVNRRKIEFSSRQQSGEEILRAAGFVGNDWELFLLRGEHDPIGGTLILANQILELKDGEHFRVIPGNRTFGGEARVRN